MSEPFDFDRAVGMATEGSVARTAQLVGDANETHVAFLTDGRGIVIRILRFASAERARQEVPVQRALDAAGITTPISLMLSNGDVVGEVSGAQFTASWLIDGRHPATVSRALQSDFGRTLATIHLATTGIVVDGHGWLNGDDVAAAVAAVGDADFRDQLHALRRDAEQLFCADLPRATIHGDVWPGNVFAESDRITAVLDLETVESAPRILDVGRTAVALVAASTRTPSEVLTGVSDAYDEVVGLTDDERRLLPLAYTHAVVASAAWNVENGHARHATTMVERMRADPPILSR